MNVQVLTILFIVIITIIYTSGSHLEYFDPPSNEVENLKMLSKYLLLIIRQRDAQDELFKLANGHARVYHPNLI